MTGTRVFDLTNALAGSSATKMLADLGAEVIKIESPGTGDYTPGLDALHIPGAQAEQALGRGQPQGAGRPALVRKLAPTSDVLVQSVRPGAAVQLGLSGENLAKMNLRLIIRHVVTVGRNLPGLYAKAFSQPYRDTVHSSDEAREGAKAFLEKRPPP